MADLTEQVLKNFGAVKVVKVPETSYTDLVKIGIDRFTESASGYVEPVYFVVASVELGNTTTKCIVTATNMRDGKIYLLNKTVKLTKGIRKPLPGETVFGKTVWGKELTLASVSEYIRDTLKESIAAAKIDKDSDLNFVARSTGVTAGFASPEEVGGMIRALAEGCLAAGISPSKMVAPLSKDHAPEKLRPYSKLDIVPFDGAIAGSLPPKTPSEVVANEMEAELSTAGIKVGAKWVGFDFRNPVLTLDFGTTLKGRITDDALPYANTLGSVAGLGGAIADALIQGAEAADSALEAFKGVSPSGKVSWDLVEGLAQEVYGYLRVMKVPSDAVRFGTVPVNPKAAEKAGVYLVGCDAGENGSSIPQLRRLGGEIRREHGLATLSAVLDLTLAKVAAKIVELAFGEGLVSRKVSIGVTGRAGTTGEKPRLVAKLVNDLGIYKDGGDTLDHLVFVEDGLALGASAMGRCMFRLGTPQNPLGGRRGGGCVLSHRLRQMAEAPLNSGWRYRDSASMTQR